MPKKETFGKFILLGELERWGLGVEYRAAQLGAIGLEKIVTILRLDAALNDDPAAAKRLMDHVKLAAQLHGPNIRRVLGIGRIESAYYICFEFIEGKSLRATFDRCRQEGFPFSVDHALLIASKVCSALEAAHAGNPIVGQRYFHGLLTPRNVHVSYEGDATVRGFGYWPGGLGQGRLLGAADVRYLAPEQAAGEHGDVRSDVFAVGSLMFEALTGKALFDASGPQDLSARLSQVKLQNPPGEDDSLPLPLLEILEGSLAGNPEARYAEIQEMRKAIDRLLFSGEFTPTTFNLAFFMHSLFRDDIEVESKLLREEKEASYVRHVAEEPVAEATAFPTPVPAERFAPAHRSAPAPAPAEPPGEPSRDTGPGFGMSRPEPKSKRPLLAGVAVLALIVGGGAVFMWRDRLVPSRPTPPPPTTMSAAAAAALARVEELEARLAQLEAEREAAEAQAAEEARQQVEADARARGRQADADTVARAEAAARKRAQAEQSGRIQAEKDRLEQEKLAEEARLAEERSKAEAQAALEAATPPPTTQPAPAPTTLPPTPSPTTQPPIQKGMLVKLTDPGVVPPTIKKAPRVQYPTIALRQRVQGTVMLMALVDENGNVAEVTVVTEVGGKSGLTEAAVKSVKRRVYNPATKDGVPVKTWLPVNVRFTLPGS